MTIITMVNEYCMLYASLYNHYVYHTNGEHYIYRQLMYDNAGMIDHNIMYRLVVATNK